MDWLIVVGTIIAIIVVLFVSVFVILMVSEHRRFSALTPEEQQQDLAKRAELQAREAELRAIVKEQSAVDRAARQELKEQRKPLADRRKAAEKDYARRVREAEHNCSKRKLEADRQLQAAHDEVERAEAMGRQRVVGFKGHDGNIEAYENRINVSGKSFEMNKSMRATVSSSGNFFQHSRSTLTRMAAGGLLFGPVGALAGGMVQKTKTHDTRELYLLVESDDFAAVITCAPGSGASAQRAASAINNAAKTADGLDERRAAGIASAEEKLQAAKVAHASQVAEAEADRDRLRRERSELDEAKAALDRFDADNGNSSPTIGSIRAERGTREPEPQP